MPKYKMGKDTFKKMLLEHVDVFSTDEIVEIITTAAPVTDLISSLIKGLDQEKYVLVPLSGYQIRFIEISQILYFSQPKKNIGRIHLFTGEVVSCFTLSDSIWVHLEDNPTFKQIDSGVLVNMNMINWYDSDLNRVYFSLEHYINATSAAVKNILVKSFGKEKDLKYNKGIIERPIYRPLW
ncbi:hypothetical protein ACFQZE_06830 [Paenibacillus sp. GCM10027627]|uniref:hypothetical protein n=1 Tax=unclassified Paenibacillus TaxID=185978 RepID=UPI003645F1DD